MLVCLLSLICLLRRVEYLSRARNLVLCDYHNTMLGTGDAQEDDPATAGEDFE